MIIDIGFVWVVPVFVMISGALILGSRMATESPARFYRRRALRLVPAIIAWHLIYLIGVRIWMRGEELPLPRILQMLVDGSVFTNSISCGSLPVSTLWRQCWELFCGVEAGGAPQSQQLRS